MSSLVTAAVRSVAGKITRSGLDTRSSRPPASTIVASGLRRGHVAPRYTGTTVVRHLPATCRAHVGAAAAATGRPLTNAAPHARRGARYQATRYAGAAAAGTQYRPRQWPSDEKCRRGRPWSAVLPACALTACWAPHASAAGRTGSCARPASGRRRLDAAPFATLAAVEQAAGPGDTIVVLPARRHAPLDGGIALKPGQKLVGAGPAVSAIGGNPAAPLLAKARARNSGDAVPRRRCRGLNIAVVGAYRGGIYGSDVKDVTFTATT